MAQLGKDILNKLITKTGNAKTTIRKDLSILRREFPNCTLNAVASIYAQQHGFSIMRMLSNEDKVTLPSYNVVTPKKIVKSKTRKEKTLIYLTIKTSNQFYNKHISEINNAYNAHCYTSVNILLRKIIENMVIDILKHKYPPNKKENKELYYDANRRRYLDFSMVLKNFYDKRNDFNMLKKQIERLHVLCLNFKDGANDRAHSLYYIVERKTEIDDLHVDTIFDLVKEISKDIGLDLFI